MSFCACGRASASEGRLDAPGECAGRGWGAGVGLESRGKYKSLVIYDATLDFDG